MKRETTTTKEPKQVESVGTGYLDKQPMQERERERDERNIRDKYEICECDDLMKDKYEKYKYERLMEI